ncbi:MAG: heavy-metal-associated domain-containing protein [Magnetococcus sp. YQC-9]
MTPAGTCEVTHTLRISGMVCAACAEIITEGLTALDGVRIVRAYWQRSRVTITYDLLRVRLEALEKLLTEIGFPPDPGLIQRLRRDWWRFADQNTLDHCKHRGACCSRSPY